MPVRRNPLLTGAVTTAVAGGLLAGSWYGAELLAGLLFAFQVVLVLAWLAALEVIGGTGAFVVSVAAAAAADALVTVENGAHVGDLAGVLGVAMVASLGHQIVRRRRRHVTISLAGTVSAVVLVVATATYVPLRYGADGRSSAVAAFAGIGAATLLACLVDLGLPRPAVLGGGNRGWAGLVLGLAAAAGAGWLVGHELGGITPRHALEVALVTGGVALAADLGIDAGRVAYGDADERARSALDPVEMLVPVAVAAPAAYVVGRLLLG